MNPLYEDFRGHRAASSSVWAIASEKMAGKTQVRRAKFFATLFHVNFSFIGIYTTDWPVLGGCYADLYAILHGVVHYGGFFVIISNPDVPVTQLSQYGSISPSLLALAEQGADVTKLRGTLRDVFVLLGWPAAELEAAQAFKNAFVDVYVRYLLAYEQLLFTGGRLSNRILKLIRDAWQGAFMRPYIGSNRGADAMRFVADAVEEPDEPEESVDSSEAGEPSTKMDQNKPDEPDVLSEKPATTVPVEEYLSPGEDDASPFACIFTPSADASMPVTNYNRTGHHLNQITAQPHYNFGRSRFITYDDSNPPMTDMTPIKSRVLYRKKDLCFYWDRSVKEYMDAPLTSILGRTFVTDPVRALMYSSLPPGTYPAVRQPAFGERDLFGPVVDETHLAHYVFERVLQLQDLITSAVIGSGKGKEGLKVLAKQLEIGLLDIYNASLCDNGQALHGFKILLQDAHCLSLLYSIASDNLGPLYASREALRTTSLHELLAGEWHIYHNIILYAVQLLTPCLPYLGLWTKPDDPGNIWFTLSSELSGNYGAMVEHLLSLKGTRIIEAMVLLLSHTVHRQFFSDNSPFIFSFLQRRPDLVIILSAVIWDGLPSAPPLLHAIDALAIEGQSLVDKHRDDIKVVRHRFNRTRLGNLLARKSYLIHCALILYRVLIGNRYVTGIMLTTLESFLHESLMRISKPALAEDASEPWRLYCEYLSACVHAVIDIIGPLLQMSGTSELHVLLLSLLEDCSTLPEDISILIHRALGLVPF
ncbi:hypothetical protein GMRT_14394 [Giardia muris]|uniref:Uncharacterized protein n=1 Tax=Giardia muris TaxID=5742 RepID=A0A4Z1SQU6_GIAMU|nr:hypothetical protein GMRT_14394 [Giardia muris]|eukprot:TNJ28242.1 hypothetical protein GMRT_14394 [Giardia muris]